MADEDDKRLEAGKPASEHDAVEVLVEGEGHPEAKAAEKTDEKPRAEVPEAIDQLRRQLEVEKAHRAAEAAARREAETRASEASRHAEDARTQAIDSAVDAAKRAGEQAATKIKAAMEAGDYAALVEAQRDFNRADMQLSRLEEQRAAAERAPTPTTRVEDPVEGMARVMSPPAANWLRAHPEYARDRALTDKMLRADARAFGEGMTRDSDEYFARVEELLGLREVPKPAAAATPRNVQAQAPVSRDPPPSLKTGQNGQRSIRLTPEMRKMASDLGMSEQAYAKQLLAAQDAGQLTVTRV